MTERELTLALRLWMRIREPRIISVLRFFMYLGFLAGGIATIHSPPTSIQGAMGLPAMIMLGWLLAAGALMGAVSVLPGAWWLERVGVATVALYCSGYMWIIMVLHVTEGSTRLLQAAAVFGIIFSQSIRFVSIWERPYDPDLRQL